MDSLSVLALGVLALGALELWAGVVAARVCSATVEGLVLRVVGALRRILMLWSAVVGLLVLRLALLLTMALLLVLGLRLERRQGRRGLGRAIRALVLP
jgi:hypothetical protein